MSSTHWHETEGNASGRISRMKGTAYRPAPKISSLYEQSMGGHRFPVPFSGEIPTAGKRLVRNDMLSSRLLGHTEKQAGTKPACETVKKGLFPFLTKELQSAARTSCPLTADKTHTCSLSCIFCQVHAPTENDQNPFAACGRQTLRGFFDTLKSTAAFVLRRCFHGNVTRGTGLPRRQSG